MLPQVSFATDVPLGYTSQEQHSDSLLDYGARYYDADLARFPQADRVDVFEMSGNPQDLNAYAYVKNNPVNRVDPSGNTDVPTFDQLSGFDTSYQSYSVNTNIICCDTTGMEYIDGNWIDTTQEFSMDYYEQDLAGEYDGSLLGKLGVSPSIGVPLKGVWDEVLRTISLTSRMMGGESLSTADKFDVAMAPFGMISGGAATIKGLVQSGKLDMIVANRVSIYMREKYIGNLDKLFCSTMCLGDAARFIQANNRIGAIGHVSSGDFWHFFAIIEKNGIPWVVDTSLVGKTLVNGLPEKTQLLKEGFLSMPLERYIGILEKNVQGLSKSLKVNPMAIQ